MVNEAHIFQSNTSVHTSRETIKQQFPYALVISHSKHGTVYVERTPNRKTWWILRKALKVSLNAILITSQFAYFVLQIYPLFSRACLYSVYVCVYGFFVLWVFFLFCIYLFVVVVIFVCVHSFWKQQTKFTFHPPPSAALHHGRSQVTAKFGFVYVVEQNDVYQTSLTFLSHGWAVTLSKMRI